MENRDSVAQKDIDGLFKILLANRQNVAACSADERIIKLKQLRDTVLDQKSRIEEAVNSDFRKAPPETRLTEIYMIISEINHALKNLKRWMEPEKVRTPLSLIGSRSWIKYVPKGVCLIISPWNYPFQLSLGPFVSAVAAGNCVILKPSEFTPDSSEVVKEIISGIFEENEAVVIQGDHTIGEQLVSLPFDHIFFTGSPSVGKKIMGSAAGNLTSVTLELGGKTPVIIDASADIEKAAERISWGKFVNGGQTCIAPDYVLIPDNLKAGFITAVNNNIKKMYGEPEQIVDNKDFCRIINARHHSRLKGLINDTAAEGAKIETGGHFVDEDNYIAPTVISGVKENSPIMQEEIFGPVLPVLTYNKTEDALRIINSFPNPLALYIFSSNNSVIENILANTRPGGVLVNDTLLHYANVNLPFGGFNHSGMGRSHGFNGFKSFSHKLSIMKQSKYSMMRMLYPPYEKKVKKLIDITLKYF